MNILYFIFFLLIFFGFFISLFFLEIKPRLLLTLYKEKFCIWLLVCFLGCFFIENYKMVDSFLLSMLFIHCLTDIIERSLFTFISFVIFILGFFTAYLQNSLISSLYTGMFCFFLCIILKIIFYNRSLESLIGLGDVILLLSMIPFFDWLSYVVFIGLASLYGCLYVLSTMLFDFFICFLKKKKFTLSSRFSVPFAPFILIAYSTYSYILKVIV